MQDNSMLGDCVGASLKPTGGQEDILLCSARTLYVVLQCRASGLFNLMMFMMLVVGCGSAVILGLHPLFNRTSPVESLILNCNLTW